MHQTHKQRAPAEAVRVAMCTLRMRDAVSGMAVQMQMLDAITVAMAVKVDAITPNPPQQMRTQPNPHDTHSGFKRLGHTFRNCLTKQDRRAGKNKQCDRMPESPGQSVPDNIADLTAPSCDARHCRNVIGFKRVLHTEQKT